MAIVSVIQSELAKAVCPTGGSARICASDGPHHFVCDLVALDSLGCAFSLFELRHERLATASIEQLKKTAEKLSAKLTYLLEAIQPVEIDYDACVVQMRSVPPHKDDNGARYYELHVRRGGLLDLCRYQATPGQLRTIIPAQVTREVFLRLVQDFAAIA